MSNKSKHIVQFQNKWRTQRLGEDLQQHSTVVLVHQDTQILTLCKELCTDGVTDLHIHVRVFARPCDVIASVVAHSAPLMWPAGLH